MPLSRLRSLVAAEGVLIAHVAHREVGFEILREAGQLAIHAHLAHALLHQLAELLAHVGGQRIEHVLHLRSLLLHLLDQLVERLRRVVAEHVAVLVHEAVEVGLLAATALLQHLVEVLHHLPRPVHVLFRHVLQHLREVVEEGVHHRLLQLFE